jgi:tRNA dimethylallyltransferase
VSEGRGVLILAGPTASGKTELAIELAREFDAEIVGADSRQIYRDMRIGTAAPSPAQRESVRHHLVEFLDPRERYSAAQYAHDAIAAIDGIYRRGRRAIVVGGTGFYIRALMGGVDLAPHYDELLRDRLANEAKVHPAEFLHAWLERLDPARAEALGVNDTYRVLRALEIALASAPRTAGSRLTLQSEGYTPVLTFIDLPWNTIDARIAARTERMLQAGLVEEAERIGESAVAASAVGYPQVHAYLRGWSTKIELRGTLERATRRYARRQRAWFRAEPSTHWLPPESVRALVREKLQWASKRVSEASD